MAIVVFSHIINLINIVPFRVSRGGIIWRLIKDFPVFINFLNYGLENGFPIGIGVFREVAYLGFR